MSKRFDRKLLITEVIWDDCLLFTGGWESHASVMRQRRRIRQRSIGYVLADDKAGIVLTAALSQGGNVFGTHVIPRAQIVKQRRIGQEDSMGGKPSKGTTKDKRLSTNKKK